MTSNGPTWTQVQESKEGPKPAKIPCGFLVAVPLVMVLTALVTGLVIR